MKETGSARDDPAGPSGAGSASDREGPIPARGAHPQPRGPREGGDGLRPRRTVRPPRGAGSASDRGGTTYGQGAPATVGAPSPPPALTPAAERSKGGRRRAPPATNRPAPSGGR